MKRRLLVGFMVMVLVFAFAGTASAVTNGQPDGDDHPYVGMAIGAATGGGFWICSATAITPTVVVTAAHCFEGPDVFVSFLEEPLTLGLADFVAHPGTWTPDPDFCIACSGGLPGFDTHDVAVIVMDSPLTLSEYGALPTAGLVDTLPMNQAVDSVGYGVQFDSGGGPRYPEDGAFTRYYAPTTLKTSAHVHGDEYIKLTANPGNGKGGTCFGDSGGPNFLAGTNVILAVNSYVTNGNCAGVTYSNRIDTYALDFIGGFMNP